MNQILVSPLSLSFSVAVTSAFISVEGGDDQELTMNDDGSYALPASKDEDTYGVVTVNHGDDLTSNLTMNPDGNGGWTWDGDDEKIAEGWDAENVTAEAEDEVISVASMSISFSTAITSVTISINDGEDTEMTPNAEGSYDLPASVESDDSAELTITHEDGEKSYLYLDSDGNGSWTWDQDSDNVADGWKVETVTAAATEEVLTEEPTTSTEEAAVPTAETSEETAPLAEAAAEETPVSETAAEEPVSTTETPAEETTLPEEVAPAASTDETASTTETPDEDTRKEEDEPEA